VNGERREKIAAAVVLARRTLDKAERVVAAAEAEPQKFEKLREQMDRTGNVHGAFKQLEKRAALRETTAPSFCGILRPFPASLRPDRRPAHPPHRRSERPSTGAPWAVDPKCFIRGRESFPGHGLSTVRSQEFGPPYPRVCPVGCGKRQ